MLLFSVIIPTYNRASLLSRCLDSLICQTYKEFDVVICDDGSSDNTASVVEHYKTLLPNLTYIKNPNSEGRGPSGGPGEPRNEAMKIAKGKWFCFLDTDDWWECDKLQITADEIEKNPQVDVFYHDLMATSIKLEPLFVIKGRQLQREKAFLQLLYKGNAIPISSACVRRETMQKVGPFINGHQEYKSEDTDFWIRSAKAGCNYKYIPQILGHYLKHDNSMYDDSFELHVLDIPKKYTSLLTKSQYHTFRKWTHYRLGLIHAQRKRYKEANKEFKAALSFKNGEISAKSLIRLLQLGLRKQKS